MNPEVLAEWFRQQRHAVIRTPSTWWYEASSRVYQAFPFHWTIEPRAGEIEGLLRARNAIALRYSTALAGPDGRVSYHVICDDPEYALERLDSRARNAARHGLERASIVRVPLERLGEEGWWVEVDTCRRQGRALPMSRERWRRRYATAAGLPGFEGWAAIVEGRLAASLLCVRVDDWIEVLAQQSLAEFLPVRVNNALTYTVTRDVLQRPGVRSVFYTLQSLDAPHSVDDFKFRMGYLAKPVRQRVVLHPWIPGALVPLAQRAVRAALRRSPGHRWLAKAEGMLRFHIEGRLPAARQELPPVLREGKHVVGAAEHTLDAAKLAPAPAPRPLPAPRSEPPNIHGGAP